MADKQKVVLAYSGGLDTSIIIPWLKENHGLEVHCVAGDVGQGAGELVGLEEKAKATGAASCKVVDLRRPFLEDCVWPCLRAMAVYEGRYLLGTSMARPILAKAQVEYAREIGAGVVAHGCTGKGNDQVRFELGYHYLEPDLEIVAPWRSWEITSREDAIDYAQRKGIPIAATKQKIYSRDSNLWHISHEGGALEDPANEPPDDVWMLTVDPRQAPDDAQVVTVGYERGVPVAVDGQRLDPVTLVERLNEVGGRHGVGRVDITENRLVGMKSRGVYETPGGTIVLEGLRTLRSLTIERDTFRMCEKLMPDYADLVYTGRWYYPLRRSMDAFFAEATKFVTGDVKVRLYKGSATAIAADSPHSLYSEDLATFGASARYQQADSKGFVKLYGLPGAVAAARAKAAGEDLSGMTKLWGGVFEGGLDPHFERFNRSLPFDRRMVDEDLVGSVAWANALGGAGVLTPREVRQLVKALGELRKRCAADPTRIADAADEDVHSFVERELGALVGPLAKKLHTGRSRNDQVATDLRLWTKGAVGDLDGALADLMRALVALAERTAGLPLPGYTHLQRAQPITAGHHALAYVEMLARDRGRLADARARMDRSPLGCGALAGTAFGVDRRALARELGFEGGPTRNSLDSVSDRDHVAEVLFTASLCMIHLSRLCEDWIFMGTHEARFVRFSDAVSTGSSLMPQKRNPDALELVRGKCGRVVGHLQALLVTLKGLPLAYDKDLQEDKEGLFDALDQTTACVRVMTTVVATTACDEPRCRAAASTGYLNATDIADLLVKAGVPFRDAHERVGIAVRKAMQLACELEELPPALLQELFPEVARDLARELTVERVLARRGAIGGTAPARVRAEVKAWQKRLAGGDR